MKKSFFLFLITAILFSGCFDSPDKLTGSVTILIDGEERTAKEPVGFLEFEESNGQEVRFMTISGYFPETGENINVVIRNYDFQSPPEKGILEKPYYNSTLPAGEMLSDCEEINNVTLCDHGVVLYVLNMLK
jgi:hypothetical protein